MMVDMTHKHINENPDSLEIGTPSKGGVLKVYGDFNNKEAFQKKIDNAVDIRVYANTKLNMGTD